MIYAARISYSPKSDSDWIEDVVLVTAGNYTEATSKLERDYNRQNISIEKLTLELINDTDILNLPLNFDIEDIKDLQ